MRKRKDKFVWAKRTFRENCWSFLDDTFFPAKAEKSCCRNGRTLLTPEHAKKPEREKKLKYASFPQKRNWSFFVTF